MKRFTAGYLFKPSHYEIHFLKADHGRKHEKYQKNYSRDVKKAKLFETADEAYEQISEMMSCFKAWGDYDWTAVVADENGRLLRKYLTIYQG